MRPITSPESQVELSKALRFMTEALEILDVLGAPGEIGSTLDLAASRLEKFLEHDKHAAVGNQLLVAQLERDLQIRPTVDERKVSPWNLPEIR